MSPEEVAVRFHSACRRDGAWCIAHEHHFPADMDQCPTLLDYIDLAEQAAEAERERIALAIEAERDGHYQRVARNVFEKAARIARNGGQR